MAADALSQMSLTESNFSVEVFAGKAGANDFPTERPLHCEQMAYEQGRDNDLQSRCLKEPDLYKKQRFQCSDKSHEQGPRQDEC